MSTETTLRVGKSPTVWLSGAGRVLPADPDRLLALGKHPAGAVSIPDLTVDAIAVSGDEPASLDTPMRYL